MLMPFALRSQAARGRSGLPSRRWTTATASSRRSCVHPGALRRGRRSGQTRPVLRREVGGRPTAHRGLERCTRGASSRCPTPSGTTDAQLSGVDCVRSTCMAVGSVGDRAGHERVMTQLWEGKSWKMILPPRPRTMEDPTLASVSCASTTSCIAVGQFTYELGFSSLLAPLILQVERHPVAVRALRKVGKPLDTTLGAIECPSANGASPSGRSGRGRPPIRRSRRSEPEGSGTERDAEPPGHPGRRSPRRRVPERDQMRRGGIRGGGLEPQAARRMVERFAMDDRTRTRCARCERKHAERSPMHLTDELRGGRQLPARLADRARVHGAWDGSHWTATAVPDPAGNAWLTYGPATDRRCWHSPQHASIGRRPVSGGGGVRCWPAMQDTPADP